MQRLTIGAFSRLTHLSIKTLRYYHEVGLLEPAVVDPDSGGSVTSACRWPT
jgi:DNA-binding transcriptional MerR regulator